jgi:hypothetical protein
MKLSVFILLVVSINSYSQDSIAKVRKPVLECLIADHYAAKKLSIENSILRNQQAELHLQIKNYQLMDSSFRKDSFLCDSLVSLTRAESNTWEESYELEKKSHRKTKASIMKWKAIAVLGVILSFII